MNQKPRCDPDIGPHICSQCWGTTEKSPLSVGAYIIVDRGMPLSNVTFCSLWCVETHLLHHNRFLLRPLAITAEHRSHLPTGECVHEVFVKYAKVPALREASEMFSGNGIAK